LDPAGTVMVLVGSSLISILTDPVLTNKLLAKIIMQTSRSTTPVKDRTPKNKSIDIIFPSYNEMPPNDMKPKLISPTIIKVIPNP